MLQNIPERCSQPGIEFLRIQRICTSIEIISLEIIAKYSCDYDDIEIQMRIIAEVRFVCNTMFKESNDYQPWGKGPSEKNCERNYHLGK